MFAYMFFATLHWHMLWESANLLTLKYSTCMSSCYMQIVQLYNLPYQWAASDTCI